MFLNKSTTDPRQTNKTVYGTKYDHGLSLHKSTSPSIGKNATTKHPLSTWKAQGTLDILNSTFHPNRVNSWEETKFTLVGKANLIYPRCVTKPSLTAWLMCLQQYLSALVSPCHDLFFSIWRALIRSPTNIWSHHRSFFTCIFFYFWHHPNLYLYFWNSPCLIGNTSSKGPFSIAMLDYRSVHHQALNYHITTSSPNPTRSLDEILTTFLWNGKTSSKISSKPGSHDAL